MKKKVLTLCLGVLLTLSLTACVEGQHISHNVTPSDSVTETEDESGKEEDPTPHIHTADTTTWRYNETEHWHVCVDDDGERMDVDTHTFDNGVVTAPTCGANGYTTYSCIVCGYSYKTNPTNSTGQHSWSGWIDDEDGTTHHRTCSVCGTIDRESHYTAETLHEDGTHISKCICGAQYEIRENVVSYSTTDETHTQTCSYCGYEGEAEDHVVEKWEYVDTESHQGTCSVCHEEVTANHNFDEGEVTDPTHTEDGYTTYTCECGYSYQDDVVEATDVHIPEEWHDKTTHITYIYCTVGHEILDTISAEENLYISVTSEAVHREKCKICDYEGDTEDHEDIDGDGNCDVCGCILDELIYTVKNREVTIISLGSYMGTEYVFPNYVGSYPVTTLDLDSYNYSASTRPTTISIPASVKTICEDAFDDSSKLTSLTFEEGSQLETIENFTFEGCESLTELVIPNSVKTICTEAFDGCLSLKSLKFEKGSHLETIGYSSFGSCESLTELEIPASVKTIEEIAFEECESLEFLTFEEGSQLEYIGELAFYDCVSLKELTIPSSVKTIDEEAFVECESLEFLTFEENSQLETLKPGCFAICNSLTELVIPSSVKTIDEAAFAECESLESLTFEENSQLEIIGDEAFDYCSSLKYLSIPASVKEIGNWGFGEGAQLDEVYIEGSEDGTSQLTTLGAAFACSSCVGGLTTITLPGSITTITTTGSRTKYCLFTNCGFLTTINYYGTKEQWSTFISAGVLGTSVAPNILTPTTEEAD